MMLYFEIGSAAEDRIRRMPQAIINSSSVIPASDERSLRRIRPPIPPWYELPTNIARIIGLRLDLQRCLAGDQRYHLLLPIIGIHLYDRQVAYARHQPLDHNSDQ